MGAGEGCSHCHDCKLAVLWGRHDVTFGHLSTDCSCGEPGIVGTLIKVSWSGSVTVTTRHYNHNSVILKIEKFPRYISVTKQNTQLRSF